MPKLPVVTPQKLLRALLHHGFFVDRKRGSHIMLRHLDGRRTVLPYHPRDIPPGTLRGILSDIRVTEEELRELL